MRWRHVEKTFAQTTAAVLFSLQLSLAHIRILFGCDKTTLSTMNMWNYIRPRQRAYGNFDCMCAEPPNMCQREVMVDWLGSEFGGESLSGHCHSIEQLLRPRSAALVQPGTQLRKMEKGADGLDQTDAGNACFPIFFGRTRDSPTFQQEKVWMGRAGYFNLFGSLRTVTAFGPHQNLHTQWHSIFAQEASVFS